MMNRFTLRMVMALGLLMLLSSVTVAQTALLRGRVVDNEGNGIPGATVSLVSRQLSTSTSAEGAYSLENIPPGQYRIIASMMGYESSEKQVELHAGDNGLDFTMLTSTSNLDEVVVIGYGTQKKGELTGALTTISSKDFQQGAVTSPEQLIVGKVAGVQITSGGGQPGASSTIRIRAGASLNASNDPLIVVDGVPLSTGSISGVANPLSLNQPGRY